MDKVKDSINTAVSGINSKIQSLTGEIAKIIKENNEMLNANLRLSKESNEAIISLKTYSQKESASLQEALLGVSNALETIEKNRQEMVAKLQAEYIAPLNHLMEQWKALQNTLSAAEKAEKDLDSKQKDLEKKKAKPAEKVKPGEIEEAENKVQSALTTNQNAKDEAALATAKFNELKVNTLKSAFHALASIEQEFYMTSANLLSESDSKVNAIDVKKAIEE